MKSPPCADIVVVQQSMTSAIHARLESKVSCTKKQNEWNEYHSDCLTLTNKREQL